MNNLTDEIIIKPIETLKVINGDRSEVRLIFTLVNAPLNDVNPLKKRAVPVKYYEYIGRQHELNNYVFHKKNYAIRVLAQKHEIHTNQ